MRRTLEIVHILQDENVNELPQRNRRSRLSYKKPQNTNAEERLNLEPSAPAVR